ncbi:MAG TPA: hypothetical protein VJ725_16630 [Thermoanaerobaculia bacterium]|nr:hypothetical protein [Thermoanaerobaculia bacterium]
MMRPTTGLPTLSLIALLMASPAMAGQITGRVFYKDVSKCTSCKVSASIKRSGMTDKVFTDDKGYFTLKWSSDNSIDELYVNGSKKGENIRSGEYVEIRLD